MELTPELRAPFEEAMTNMYSNPMYTEYLFYAHLLGHCQIHFDSTMPAPAGVNFTTDHYNLYINPAGIPPSEENPQGVQGFNTFPLAQRLGVLKHEVLHILNGHIYRKGERAHKRFNVATDMAINQSIKPDHLPGWVIDHKKFNLPEKLTAEQYYELLPISEEDSDSGSCSGSGSGQTLDDHGKWEESTGDSELQNTVTSNMLEKAASKAQGRGSIPSEFSDWLSSFSNKRQLNWQTLLRHIAGNKRINKRKTLLRQDRRLPNFEWIKGKTKDRICEILVISDVSGSVDDAALISLWSEVRFICSVTQSDITLIQVDTRPSLPEKLTKHTKSIERKACGGTILHPALKQAKKHQVHFDCLVVTTDGYLDTSDVNKFASLNKPVIWLIEKDGQVLSEMNSGRMKAFQLKA